MRSGSRRSRSKPSSSRCARSSILTSSSTPSTRSRSGAGRTRWSTLQLASLLRRLFDALQRPTWHLSDELALIEELTALYATRDSERYRFVIDVEAGAPLELPPLLLLPLVENAIKHGPAAGHDGAVKITVVRDERALTVTVENPGAFRGRREGGTGLSTLERRLALAWGDRATLSIAAEGERTRATLVVPASA